MLLSATQAHAALPTVDSAGLTNRHLTARWTLPEGMNSYVVEAARSPETNPGPGSAKGFFLDEHRVAISFLVNPQTRNWVSTETIVPGTYYVHVGAYDPVICPQPGLGCELEFSGAVRVEVVLQPPRITTAAVNGRTVDLTWVLPAGMASDSILVATDPAVVADGTDLDGLFLSENVVSGSSLGATATSGASRKLNGGTHWIQVVARDPDACASPDTPECYAASAPVQVVVPSNPPRISSAGFDAQGRFTASWHLPVDLFSDFVEVATSPAVYPRGEREGEFLDENVVHSYIFDWYFEPRETAYVSSDPIPVRPGAYYVHVGTSSCQGNFCDIFPISDMYKITIPGPPSASPAVAADKVTAFASLSAPKQQSIRALYVRAEMAEPGTLTATGTVSVPGAARVFRLRSAATTVKPGVAVKLKLTASKKALRAVRKALRRNRRVMARIVVTARDAAGNTKTARRTVRLKR